jgi:hypothetical protein
VPFGIGCKKFKETNVDGLKKRLFRGKLRNRKSLIK